MMTNAVRGLLATIVAATFVSAPVIAQSDAAQNGHPPQAALHKRCIDAGKRVESDAEAMTPGRSWRWRMDCELSRRRLAQLRCDFMSLRDSESEFEASLTPEQKAKARADLAQAAALLEHLDKDAQSLDAELRKDDPTRWHVARDVSDMQREIRTWRKLHDRLRQKIAAGVR